MILMNNNKIIYPIELDIGKPVQYTNIAMNSDDEKDIVIIRISLIKDEHPFELPNDISITLKLLKVDTNYIEGVVNNERTHIDFTLPSYNSLYSSRQPSILRMVNIYNDGIIKNLKFFIIFEEDPMIIETPISDDTITNLLSN